MASGFTFFLIEHNFLNNIIIKIKTEITLQTWIGDSSARTETLLKENMIEIYSYISEHHAHLTLSHLNLSSSSLVNLTSVKHSIIKEKYLQTYS